MGLPWAATEVGDQVDGRLSRAVSRSICSLFKRGWLKAGARTSGLLRWTLVRTGEETASIGFESDLGEESGYVQLRWTSTNLRGGAKSQRENRITLTTGPQPFGGRRWFFICPRTGQSATKLHLLRGPIPSRLEKLIGLAIDLSANRRVIGLVPRFRATRESWRQGRKLQFD